MIRNTYWKLNFYYLSIKIAKRFLSKIKKKIFLFLVSLLLQVIEDNTRAVCVYWNEIRKHRKNLAFFICPSATAMSWPLRLSIQEEKDRISNLPDSLLHHILFFLPTKDAAVTSILSERWKPLFLAQPILSFDCKHFRDALTFSNFVERAMTKRENTTHTHSTSNVTTSIKTISPNLFLL